MEHTERIKNDSWNAELYDNKHSFVSKFGSDNVELLAPQKGEHILDVGCGTGDLAQKLFEQGAIVTGIDQSQNMIEQAKNKYPHIPFKVVDALELPYHHSFDAVFSNATLHWIKAPKQALQNIFNSLKMNGRFVAELGGKGNVELITNEVRKQFDKLGLPFSEELFPWYFPSIGEYTTLMEGVGFNVTYAHHFERPTPLSGPNGLQNWLHMFGESMFIGLDEGTKQKIISNVENNLKDVLYQNGQWMADYKRLRVIGIKS